MSYHETKSGYIKLLSVRRKGTVKIYDDETPDSQAIEVDTGDDGIYCYAYEGNVADALREACYLAGEPRNGDKCYYLDIANASAYVDSYPDDYFIDLGNGYAEPNSAKYPNVIG